MWKAAITLGLLLATTIPGCIEQLRDGADDGPGAPGAPKPASGNMTGRERSQVASGLCPGATPVGTAQPYCASKTHWIDGAIDAAALPVDLATFSGNVLVRGDVARVWNLTVVLSARGDSDALARANLGNIQFAWSHEEAQGHYLRAKASLSTREQRHHERASLTLSMPASVLLALTASSASGDVTANAIRSDQTRLTSASGNVAATDVVATWARLVSSSGSVRTERLQSQDATIESASGNVDAHGELGDARIQSASGTVRANLRPSGNASWTLSSSSGSVSLSTKEEARFGYSATASTASGRATITLRDGETTGSNQQKRFESKDYSSRAVRVTVSVNSASGNVDIAPS